MTNFFNMSLLVCLFVLIAFNSCSGAPSPLTPALADSREAPLIFPEDNQRYKIVIGSPHKIIVKREVTTESPTTTKSSVDSVEPTQNFPQNGSMYKIVRINKTGDEVPLNFPYNSCQYRIVEVDKSAAELPPDNFPTDTELYRIININASMKGPPQTPPIKGDEYKIVPVNSTAEVPEVIFPTDENKFKIIQYNATVDDAQQIFPTDTTKYRILKINNTCAEEPPLDFPTNSEEYKILDVNVSGAPLPLDIFPNNPDVKMINVSSELPALLFPDGNSSYPIIEKNISLIQSLIRQDNKVSSTPIAETSTEAKLNTDDKRSSIENFDGTTQKPIVDEATPTAATEDAKSPEPENINSDVELIQQTHVGKESGLEEAFNKPEEKVKEHEHSKRISAGSTAGILAGTFAGFAVLGYIGLVIWRQMLEKKYGTRERLITEDTYYTTNDMRHFEL